MKYRAHLSKDKLLKQVIDEVGHIKLKKGDLVYIRLIQSIVSQQLSVKAADTIFKRFLANYGSEIPTPQQILDTSVDVLRAAGLSYPKASYLHNVARFELEHGMEFDKLERMTNEEAVTYLTQIKGVGRWTVEMLLMFVLAREDVFAIDDIGIHNAMAAIYKLNRRHKRFRKQILKIADAWSPYRTYACIYLWRSLS
jgi:DNA-3-methyladenine glycosylase II